MILESLRLDWIENSILKILSFQVKNAIHFMLAYYFEPLSLYLWSFDFQYKRLIKSVNEET